MFVNVKRQAKKSLIIPFRSTSVKYLIKFTSQNI